MSLASAEISKEHSLQIKKNLLEGVVSRAGTLFFTWSFISFLYGFLSLKLFQAKIPELTQWDNAWPRLVFSSLPLLAAGIWYKRSTEQTTLKALLTVVLLPCFLMAASLIKAWPIFWSGDYDFYLRFHATNIIAMASGIFVISASPKLIWAQCIGFIVIYFGPLFLLFMQNREELAQIIFSDSLMVTIILIITLNSIHKLRFTLALDEIQRRKKASLFLGKRLTDAIYETRTMVIEDFTRDGLIMSIDLRGYTKFFQSNSPTTVRAFMSDYYSLATSSLASKKAFLHKTIGDGLLISFGVMETDVDLSDLPEAKNIQQEILNRKKTECLRQAVDVFFEMSQGLELLAEKYKIPVPLLIGAGCAFGSIDVLVRGDESYRQELDIQGNTIIRAVRLEAYSKVLSSKIDNESSFLLLSPELISFAAVEKSFKTLLITSELDSIRDFPEIKTVLYRQWKHGRLRSAGQKAA